MNNLWVHPFYKKLWSALQSKNVESYRDDGLSVVKQMPGQDLDGKRKNIIEIFKNYRLAIAIKTKCCNFFRYSIQSTKWHLQTIPTTK